MSLTMVIGNTEYRLRGDRLQISQAGDPVLDICLSPVLDAQTVKISSWHKVGHNSFKASLGKFGEAFVCEKFGKLAYWIETPAKHFQDVTYMSDGILSGDVWRTFVSDDYERLWDKKIDTNIPISSAYADLNSPDYDDIPAGMTDPTDAPPHWIWNIHVRAFAFRGRQHWLGVSIPGPWGIGVTRLNMHRARFNLRFEQLQTGCSNGRMPVVYFCPGLDDGFDVLDEHRNLSEKLDLFDLQPQEYPDWWSNPWFGYYDEMMRLMHEKVIEPSNSNVINLLRDWVAKIKDLCRIDKLNINMEQGCYRLYGDYRPAKIFGSPESVRAAIDNWRQQGVHVGHYIHPFLVNTKVPFYQEHPEAFCKPKAPGFLMTYACETWDSEDPKFAPVDWTHPLGREFMLNWVTYLISSEPECLNCDILRSNHWRSPDPRSYDFHDPDWGLGDMMTYKVQKLLYQRAKEVKPQSMVTKVAVLDCYMQLTYDMMQICEDWTHNMQYWYRRTQLATRLIKNRRFWIDPWFCTRTKWNEYFMSLMALCVPETQAVEHTTHCYYPSWQPLTEKLQRRRRAGLHVALHSPPEPSDESRLIWDYDNLEVYRRKTTGPLAGWYAALALSPKCFVTYDQTQALIASTENRLDWVPLPPKARLGKVSRLLHDGSEHDYEYVLDEQDNRLQLYIEDCGKDVFYYRITYTLSS